jgi:hypothetical protein
MVCATYDQCVFPHNTRAVCHVANGVLSCGLSGRLGEKMGCEEAEGRLESGEAHGGGGGGGGE